MNIALLADSEWFDEERSFFHHLAVGLVDEQVRVIQVMPQEASLQDASFLGDRVDWRESRWDRLNRWRLGRLDNHLQRVDTHLIHALTGRLWRGTATLADEMNVPVVFNANAAEVLDELDGVLRTTDVERIAFAASTEPLAGALRERVGPQVFVESVPTCVHLDEEASGSTDGGPLCAIVTGNGVHDEHYQALLEGLAAFCEDHRAAQFFFEGQGADQHEIWKAAGQLGLLPHVSLIPRRLGHRELLLRADVLLHPQPLGRSRSITLQAMAHGLTVIAHEDPWLDYLIDDQTAWIVRDPRPPTWRDFLQRAHEEPESARALGRRARDWIRRGRLVADQIPRLLHLYRRMTGQSLPFPAATNS